ncbi:MAG: hypothetical protein HY238_18885 [Acidobacteria bacterium]|nr:hypothetical protein [Acidobacteriota bacterium]
MYNELLAFRRLVGRATARPAFAYITIVFLQLKVVWGMWQFRDLTPGDTAVYFLRGFSWYQNWSNDISWSPLYTAFYGSFLHLSTDAYLATITHRLIIVLTLAVLVLAWMRRLLPHNLAWLVSAWWVVLPINFNATYEVHLFAVIPVLAAYLAILAVKGAQGRGAALGILLGSTLLVRNELVVATGLLGAVSLAWEIRENRKATAATRRHCVLAYGIPMGIVALLTLWFYSHSRIQFPALWADLAGKHTLNVCQVYAYSYQQRHSDWHGSTWTACPELMTRDFGTPQPSLAEAFRRNPAAVLEHARWNASLIPNGLQVLLFNAMSGRVSPDYFPVRAHSRPALILSCVLALLFLVGGFELCRERRDWWEHWLKERIWGWIAMACVAGTSLTVMLTERPRPSYIFTLGLMVMCAAGMCLHAITHRWSGLQRLAPAFPVCSILLILLVPRFFDHGTRPLLEAYRRLMPFAYVLERPGTVLVTPGYNELCHYLRAASLNACQPLSYFDLRGMKSHGHQPWPEFLDAHGVNSFYADEAVLEDPTIQPVLSNPGSFGWKIIGLQDAPGRKWMLLQKESH